MPITSGRLFRDRFPLFYSIYNKLRRDYYLIGFRRNPDHRKAKHIFRHYFERNLFGDPDSLSGTGSSLPATRTIRENIPAVLKRIGARTVLDLPCGDFYWVREIDWSDFDYLGCDVVSELIEQNAAQFTAGNIHFAEIDVLEGEIPARDVILCRDLLIHFPNAEAMRSVAAFKRSGSRYLLTTHYTGIKRNKDIPMGSFRPVNLNLEPFSFPEPETVIRDDDYIKLWGKTLAL